MSNLVLIDGPPGAGKTTLGLTLAPLLSGYRLLLEMDGGHPLHTVAVGELGADFSSVAGMELSELGEMLLAKSPPFLASLPQDGGLILESYPFQSHLRVPMQMNAYPEYMRAWLTRF